jgi:UDP-N-acetylmuramoyl-L-alanyl-D-glutamate--2,6-diaminopimelate ligase
LSTVAAIVPENGRLISVFGCGGNRDKGKRTQMGLISGKYADLTIVTSDNPRNEEPDAIIADIETGLHGVPYRLISDRHQAIYEALNEAHVNDIVLIAGKGHEDYQIIGETKHPFSDIDEAREALASWKGRT